MQGPPKHILVIEDSAVVREMYASALGGLGFSVTTVGNAKDAFRAIAKERFHLIILDLMLPGMNGFEVCKLLKRDVKTFNIPIIVASVLKGVDPEVFAIESGADDFLFKPFDERVLQARIQMVLRRHEQNAALNPLTGLYSRIWFEEAVAARLQTGEPFAMIRFDLRGFRTYNRHYSYQEGDYFLKFIGAIVKEGSLAHGTPEDIVGHLVGDDFAILTRPENAEAICDYVIKKFQDLSGQHYEEEDLERGYMEVKTRTNSTRDVPLLTLHGAVVTNEIKAFENLFEIFDTAEEILIFHKQHNGTGWMKDRRKD